MFIFLSFQRLINMDFGNKLEIIGTSHIAKQSIQEIKVAILTRKPDIVAVELDIQRAAALLQNQKSDLSLSFILKMGLKGYIFAKIGQIAQQKLGKMVGVAPGSDMKTAILTARKEKLEVRFIDQPIAITLKKFSKTLKWKEKFRFATDFFQGLLFPKKQIKKLGLENFDLSKVPKKELISKMILQIKDRYPSVYKTLIVDRNKYMVKELIKLMRANPEKKILAVVGAGHEEGMKELLLKIDVV